MSLKKIIGKVCKFIFPRKVYKLLANGWIIVPAYYKNLIIELENNFDLSLEERSEKTILLMRKYGHIIDKGLQRLDVEPGHGIQYYYLLKECVSKIKLSEYATDPTVDWAEGKLAAYEQLQSSGSRTSVLPHSSYYKFSFEKLKSIIETRRSNRSFKPLEVTWDTISQLRNLVNWAPSSCNKQPIEIYVTNNPLLAKRCLKCCKGGTGFGEFIPSFWVFTANILGYVWPNEAFLPAIDVSLGVENVLLGATALNLSGTLLSWAEKDNMEEAELRNLLNIPSINQIIICAVLGYASYEYSTPIRKLS